MMPFHYVALIATAVQGQTFEYPLTIGLDDGDTRYLCVAYSSVNSMVYLAGQTDSQALLGYSTSDQASIAQAFYETS
jgi:hypothetical protein